VSEKGLAPVLIILLVALVLAAIGGAYYFGIQQKQPVSTPQVVQKTQPTASSSAEIADWKTYTDSKFGYTLSYPGDYKLTSGNDLVTFTSPKVDSNGKPILLSVSVSKNNFTQNDIGSYSPFDYKVIQHTGNYYLLQVYTYQVGDVATAQTQQQAKEIFNKFLSSFKFTDSASNATSDMGTVSGKLCYPAETIPAGKIVAKEIFSGKLYSQDYPGIANGGGIKYTFSLPKKGEYYLRFEPEGVSSSSYGYHTSVCSNGDESTCSDTQKRSQVAAGLDKTGSVTDFNLCDYYYTDKNAPDF
jgi:hypothetical protein